MCPVLFHYGHLVIPAYGFAYGAAAAVCMCLAILMGTRRELPKQKMAHTMMISVVAMFLGSRALAMVQTPPSAPNQSAALDLTSGGQSLFGGLFAASVALYVACRLMKLPIAAIADILAAVAPIGIAIGRFGCWCRGCCFGRVGNGPFAHAFPAQVGPDGGFIGSPALIAHIQRGALLPSALESLPVHPTQLYEAAAMVLVAVPLFWLWQRGSCRGALLAVFGLTYSIARFGLEFFRDSPVLWWHFTSAQVWSVVVGIGACAGLIMLSIVSKSKGSPD